MKISFVVPVYNVERYLRQCVESITKQDYRDIEVILVDDGSPDGCPALCDELARDDNRIKVIHQPHGGLSNARNSSIRYVTGEYLMYVDSDDYLLCDEGFFDRLVELVRKNNYPDYLCLNRIDYYSERKMVYLKPYDDELFKIKDRDSLIKYFVQSGHLPTNACTKFLKVSFLQETNLTFLDGVVSEDNPWFIDLLDKAETFLFVNEYCYCYRLLRPGSITSTYNLFYFGSQIKIIEYYLHRMCNMRFKEESKQYLLSNIGAKFCSNLMRIYKLPKSVRKDKWKELKQYTFLLDYDKCPQVRIVNRARKIFGLEITRFLLQIYDRFRTLVCRHIVHNI